jgi:hypothetical protein
LKRELRERYARTLKPMPEAQETLK